MSILFNVFGIDKTTSARIDSSPEPLRSGRRSDNSPFVSGLIRTLTVIRSKKIGKAFAL